jgi:hypothetical protein
MGEPGEPCLPPEVPGHSGAGKNRDSQQHAAANSQQHAPRGPPGAAASGFYGVERLPGEFVVGQRLFHRVAVIEAALTVGSQWRGIEWLSDELVHIIVIIVPLHRLKPRYVTRTRTGCISG